ncbi:PRC-barrel domain-containing protein [Kineosporia sp. NBRC 101731]|uniref:PRC-barrel domain-containing protein n=1 Tax=Kineosporia sp. NBRC 101731 TaxID=3032199 RepID=UPI0024A1F960|nr:PRC-barrel domain-containing protein [Kineosporia sp. NBRC 101731]GLY30279.1 hypothetical protein Kisp02_36440 [Kineosporia sp. NBRC 101731]
MNVKPQEARELVGRPIHDARGEHLGDVSGVYFNDSGHTFDWLSIISGDATAFVPAGGLRDDQERLTLPFSGDVLDNQPHIEPHDGALSNAQVARLHEFFHTFDGHTRITTASEGEPLATPPTDDDVPFTGRGHEAAFGTGATRADEPHDVTLQGNGNFAP